MALNPTFASASVNPSQSIGSDASAPAQGALPTGNYNQPQYTMPFNQPSTFDISQNAYLNSINRQSESGGIKPSYEDWSKQQMNRPGGGQSTQGMYSSLQPSLSPLQPPLSPPLSSSLQVYGQNPGQFMNDFRAQNAGINPFAASIGQQPQNFDDFYKSPEYQQYQTDNEGGMGTMDMYDSPYFGLQTSGSKGRAQDDAYEKYLAKSGTTTPETSPNLGGALKNILGGNFNSTTTQPTDYAQNDALLPQNIQEFLKKDRAGSAYDAGGNWSYDPTTQKFNSYTMGGSQTKSLAEMQDYVNNQGGMPDSDPIGNNTLGQQPQYTSPMNQPQGNMPPMGVPLGRFIPATNLPDGIRNSEGGSYEYPQAKPLQSFFEGSTKGQVPAPRYTYFDDEKADYSQLGLSQSALDSLNMMRQAPDMGQFYYDTQTKTFGQGMGRPSPNIPGQRRYIGKTGIPLELMNKLGSGESVDFSKYAQYDEGPPLIQPQDVGQLGLRADEPTSPPLAPMRQDYTNPSDFEGLTFATSMDALQNAPIFEYGPGATREDKLRNMAPYMTRENYANNLNELRRPADSILGSTGNPQQPVQQPQVLGPQVPYQDPQGLIGPTPFGPGGLPQFTSPQQTTTLATATPTGTTPMATNPLSTYATTPTTGFTPAPNLNVTPGASSSGNFGQGGVLPNVTTTQQQVTAAPSFYTDYLNQLATKGGQAAENAQYVGAQPLQEQAFNLASQNVGNYQPTLQNAINLASSVGNTNLAQAIGDVGQANIARNLAPQATAGIVGSGQFGSKRGAQALGDVIANAELGLTAQQQQAMQQDMANRIAAAQQLGTLANTTQQLGLGDLNALSTLGQQQQTIAQNQQLFPMQQLANQSALLRGYNIPTSVSASQTGPGQQGQFQTSPLQQIMSVGTLLGALAKPGVGGTSAGSNIYGGIEDILKKLSSKFTSSTGSTGSNSTISPITGLPIGVPGGATVQPDGTYVDTGGTKYIVNDDGTITSYSPDGTFDRSDPSNYDEDITDTYPGFPE